MASKRTIEEVTIIKVTPPPTKKRDAMDFWNLDKRPYLKEAIDKCLATGNEQMFVHEYDTVYHIKPTAPFIPEAMARPENADVMNVSINVYHVAFHLCVHEGSHDN